MKAVRLLPILSILFILILSLLCIFYTSEGEAQSVFSTARMKIPSFKQDHNARIDRLTEQGTKFLSSKPVRIEEAKTCIDSALYLCEKEETGIPAKLHLLMARYNLVTSDYLNASSEATLAMEKAEKAGEDMVLVNTLFFLGGYYRRTGFYNESLDFYARGISLAEQKGLKGMIQMGYSGQADVYNSIGNIEEYEQSLKKMIEASLAENDSVAALRGYYYYGTLKGEASWDFKLSDSLLTRSYEFAVALKDTMIISRSLGNLGYSNYLAENYKTALSLYNKSLKYCILTSDYIMLSNAYGNIGTIYRDMGDIDRSVANYNKGIEYAKRVNDYYELYWIYHDMSNMYLKQKDTANAYLNYVLFKQYSDSTMIKNRNQWVSDATIRYKVDTQQKEVQLLSLRLKNQRILSYAFGSLVLLTLAIAFLIYRGTKLKSKRRISEMNRHISEIQQANLRQQMNPHFIFNTLNSIQYYMYQHDKLATNNYLTKFSSLIRKVLENSQHTSIPLSDELNALTLYLELESLRFKDRFDYEISIDDEIDTLMYKVPTMLIQPYVENSICHGLIPMKIKGKVKIDIKLKNDYLVCTIEDNGIGRGEARERKVKKESNYNSLGTRIATSRLELVNTLYGSSLKTTYTDLKNAEGKAAGTLVEIHIPLMT
jgi:tetratricopeptide (TPR) repeat protein